MAAYRLARREPPKCPNPAFQPLPREQPLAVGCALSWNIWGVLIYTICLIHYTGIANAAFLFATAPFMAALLGWFILNERIRLATISAMLLALVGIVVMVYHDFSSGSWLGDGLALISAFGFAVFTISLRIGKSVNTMPVVFLGGMFAIILSSMILVAQGVSLDILVWEFLLAFTLGACLLSSGMILITIGSRIVPAAELALLSMSEVILAPIWAWLLLNEIPSASVLVGGAILTIALVYNAQSGMRHKPVLANI